MEDENEDDAEIDDDEGAEDDCCERTLYHILYPSSSLSNAKKNPRIVRNTTTLPKMVNQQAPHCI